MRALSVSAIILGILALALGASFAFYWLAAFAGVATEALFGAGYAYIGTGVVNVITLVLVVLMVIASMLTLAERKWSALMQDRIGPNRARIGLPILKHRSLAGLPHFLADGAKMLFKEDVIPAQVSAFLYKLAPMLAFGTIFVLFIVVPVGPTISASSIPGIAAIASAWGVDASEISVGLHVAPGLDAGLLYLFAISGIAVYGTALAGWASNNKLALLGGVRAASQMIAYEVALGLSLVGCMMAYGSLRLEDMTSMQTTGLFGGVLPAWGIFLQPVGFFLFFAAAFAETKRAPFDAPEGESEVVGYFVEYSGMRFGLFMISEFMEIVVLSGVVASVFLGGFHLPVPPAFGVEAWIEQNLGSFALAAILALNFLMKVAVLCWVQLLIRWSLLRFRIDQIQVLGWKILLPLALFNIFLTGVLLLLDTSFEALAIVGLAELALLIGVTALYPVRKPETIKVGGRPASVQVLGGHH